MAKQNSEGKGNKVFYTLTEYKEEQTAYLGKLAAEELGACKCGRKGKAIYHRPYIAYECICNSCLRMKKLQLHMEGYDIKNWLSETLPSSYEALMSSPIARASISNDIIKIYTRWTENSWYHSFYLSSTTVDVNKLIGCSVRSIVFCKSGDLEMKIGEQISITVGS